MKVFDEIKSKNIDELAEWLDKHGVVDDSPWMQWWDKTYCSKCDPEIIETLIFETKIEHAWCEVYHKCRFFQDMEETPDSKQIIKMWLESET